MTDLSSTGFTVGPPDSQPPQTPHNALPGADPVTHTNEGAQSEAAPLAASVPPMTNECMKRVKRWLLWKLVPKPDPSKKPDKVPYYANGVPRGKRKRSDGSIEDIALDGPEDWAQLVSFEDTCAAAHARPGFYTGPAFALGIDGHGGHWQGADADNLPVESLQEGASHMVGYVEISPSGNGLHAIGYGRPFKTLGSNGSGIEAYSSGRYFTYTENMVKDEPIRCIAEFVETKLAPYHAKAKATKESDCYAGVEIETVDAQVITDLRYALTFLLADDRDLWIYVGHALKTLGNQGRALWMEWSRNVADPAKFDPLDLNGRWNGFNPTNTSYRAVFKKAQDASWVNPNSNAARAGAALVSQGNIGSLGAGGQKASPDPEKGASLLSKLRKKSATNELEELKMKAETEVLVFGEIGSLGQFISLHAHPNKGKTLITLYWVLQAIEKGIVKGENVFFLNFDDNANGFIDKTEIANELGFNMLGPNQTSVDEMSEILAGLWAAQHFFCKNFQAIPSGWKSQSFRLR